MKKQVVLALMLALGLGVQAQGDTTASITKKIEIQIEENTLSWNADKTKMGDLATMIGFATTEVTKLQTKHKAIVAKIEALRAEGKISEEEADRLLDKAEDSHEASMDTFEMIMENWGESYAAKWESWAEEYEANMEDWESKMEAGDSVPPSPPMPPMPPILGMDEEEDKKEIVISKDGIVIKDGENEEIIDIEEEVESKVDLGKFFEDGERKKSKKIDRTEDYFDIALGFNQQLEDGQFLIEDKAGELDFWRSTSFNLGFGWKSRIGNPYSKVYLKYGLDFSWHNFRLNNSEFLTLDANNGAMFDTTSLATASFDKSKYHIAYFNIPVMLQLDFSEPGDRDEAFTLGVGGYAGIRLLAKTELEYSTAQYRRVEETRYDDFGTEQFRYGLMAQVGFDSFKITASYDLNEFFRPNRGPNYNMANITLGFTL